MKHGFSLGGLFDAYEACNEKELIIKGLVEFYDLKVSGSGSVPGCVCAVGALEKIYDKFGYETLDKILHLIIITWEGEPKSFSANMLNGIARLIYAYGDALNEATFKEKLGEVSVKEISKVAKERRAGSLGYAEAMLIFYLKRMKNPLPWKDLYANKRDRNKEKVKNISLVEEANENRVNTANNSVKNIS